MLARISSLLLTLAAALTSLVIVAPAPRRSVAFLAVAVCEKSFLVALAALAGLVGTWLFSRGRSHNWRWLALLFATPAVLISFYPFAQAAWLAASRDVNVDLGRFLLSRIDTGRAAPDQTLVFASAGGQPLALDVYRPPAQKVGQRVPAVIVVHGGGWSGGDKGETPLASRWLSEQGFAVFDIQYRIQPQPNWKTATGDVKCAVGWVKANAARTGVTVDPARVTLLGRSAGGHLALLAGYTPDDPALPPSCPVKDVRVAAVVAYYAPTDLVWGFSRPANIEVYDTTARLREFLGGTPETAAEAFRQASIVNRVTRRSPRTLLVQGGRDQFVSPQHVDRLLPHLKAAGVPHETVLIPYGQHGFDYVVGGLGGQIVESALLSFLRADEPPPPKKPPPKVAGGITPGEPLAAPPAAAPPPGEQAVDP
jgi:acetyl esterase/lipase